MIFESRYEGRSGFKGELTSSELAFATNTLRETTFFEGTLREPLLLREALACLYHVVVSDYKYRPRDRAEFFAWLEQQDRKFLATLAIKGSEVRQELEQLESRLAELDDARKLRLRPFHRARYAYFNHIYEDQYELDLILDPVITVQPDETSFEAFSRDESTYARLGASHEIFGNVGSMECGTTNIDFSLGLHSQMERLRTYRQTRFAIDPRGFSATHDGGKTVHEKKIELPDSWMKGFLQVHATMSMGLTHVRMAPVDLFNICRAIRIKKARSSPRALRYELTPGALPYVVLEPWETKIPISGGEEFFFKGNKSASIRTWGRDRLSILRRLLPVCRGVDVYLAGFGLPSFYVLDLGPINFTLALSGWTDNDWTGHASFELLTRRLSVSADELLGCYESLRDKRLMNDAEMAKETGLGQEKCRSALSYLCQAGRAMVDLSSDKFRHRDLLFEPFDLKAAQATIQRATEEHNEAAKAAREIFEKGMARFTARRPVTTGYKLSGSVRGTDNKRVRPLLHVDHDGRIIEATCTCREFVKHKMTQGPCQHMLALRLAHMQRLEDEDM